MTRQALCAALLALSTCGLIEAVWQPSPALAQASQAAADDLRIRELLQQVERAAARSDRNAYLAVVHPSASRGSAERFLNAEFRGSPTRAVVQERERLPGTMSAPGEGYVITVDAFIETGDRARIVTWAMDIRRLENGQWSILDQRPVSSVENLYRLTLNAAQQFDVNDFTVVVEDMELTLAEGSVFTVETDQGITGMVLIGRGDMNFHPTPRTEIEQVRIFAGADTLTSRFDAAFVRVGTFEAHADRNQMVPRAVVDPRDLRRAEQIFREESAKSFVLDLADLTRETWSLLPGPDDFLAEVRTRRFDTLTYARSNGEAEDISVFERKRQRNIAVYASKDKLLARGRFYNEDDLSPFDVLDHQIDVRFTPDRQFIEGQATMQLRVRAENLGQLTLRLADALTVQSVTSDKFGRLFHLRVANQNTVLVNLPFVVQRNDEMTLKVEYAGRLDPQEPERELVAVQRDQFGGSLEVVDESAFPKLEPTFLYSNRSYWHPAPPITDYATATIAVTVPGNYGVIASGTLDGGPVDVPGATDAPARRFTFNAERPLRYLAFLVSKLQPADQRRVQFDQQAVPPGVGEAPALETLIYDRLELTGQAHARQVNRAKTLLERAEDIARFYESLIGDSPYGTFTLAVIEGKLPGGHSPGYFAALNQPLSNQPITWRNDPAAFSSYPEFFLAHELAHQWWGQAVGWRNYHEQWLSEGFAQYFAALYAEKFRGDEVFSDMIRQMSRWAVEQSPQGPVYLGYRVGHIKNDSRAFRAVIYNKGAIVIHMLRQLMGDEAFFGGLREFYRESRFTKVGTDDLRRHLEASSGQPLDRFFERWVYNSSLPKLTFTWKVETTPEGQAAVLHFEQGDEVFDMPAVVTLQFADRREVTVVVPLTEKVVDHRMPIQGTLRLAEINRDAGGLAGTGRN